MFWRVSASKSRRLSYPSRRAAAAAASNQREMGRAAPVDIDSPYDFSSSSSLALLDASLRCQICQELYTAPVLLSRCSHTFCSICVRSHLANSEGSGKPKVCPVCRIEADVGQLRKNSVVEECVRAWEAARPTLISLLALSSINNSGPTATVPASTMKRRSSSASTSQPASSSRKRAKLEDEREDAEIELDLIPSTRSTRARSNAIASASSDPSVDGKSKHHVGSSTGKGKGRRDRDDGSSDIEIIEAEAEIDLSDPTMLVICPICQGEFKNMQLNIHLDRCNGVPPKKASSSLGWSNIMSSTQGSTSTASGRKKLNQRKGKEKEHETPATDKSRSPNTDSMEKRIASVSYSGMSLRELTKHLVSLGLPTTYTSTLPLLDALKRRHRHYLLLWNANLDFLSPLDPKRKSSAALLRELLAWEALQDAAGAGGEVIGTRAEHRDKYDEQFRELTKAARASAAKMREIKSALKDSDVEAAGGADAAGAEHDRVLSMETAAVEEHTEQEQEEQEGDEDPAGGMNVIIEESDDQGAQIGAAVEADGSSTVASPSVDLPHIEANTATAPPSTSPLSSHVDAAMKQQQHSPSSDAVQPHRTTAAAAASYSSASPEAGSPHDHFVVPPLPARLTHQRSKEQQRLVDRKYAAGPQAVQHMSIQEEEPFDSNGPRASQRDRTEEVHYRRAMMSTAEGSKGWGTADEESGGDSGVED